MTTTRTVQHYLDWLHAWAALTVGSATNRRGPLGHIVLDRTPPNWTVTKGYVGVSKHLITDQKARARALLLVDNG